MDARRGFLAAVIVILAAVCGLAWRGRAKVALPERPGADRPFRERESARAPAASPAVPTADPLIPIRGILRTGNADALAGVASLLRSLARRDASVREALFARLSDSAEDPLVREVVAFILGSLSDTEVQSRLAALLTRESDPALVRAFLLALGSQKPEGDDDLFGYPESPWCVAGKSGLRILVQDRIDDAGVRQAVLEAFRAAEDPELRWTAVRVIRHSTEHPDVRDFLSAALERERDPVPLSECGAALAAWAAASPEQPEAGGIVARLLEMGRGDDQASLRMTTRDSLQAFPLGADAVGRLSALVQGREEGIGARVWAADLLSLQADRMDPAGRSAVAGLFLDLAGHDSSDKLREKAAWALGRLAGDARVAPALAGSLRSDPAWNVRDAAAQALGRIIDPASEALEALKQASSLDPHPAVRETARRALARLGR